MPVIRIAPSILSADFARLGEQVAEAEAAGADQIHIDVMDGRFVPNLTMGPLVVEAVRRVTSLPLDVHLMIVEPERYLDVFADAGADWLTVHVEATPHVHRALQHIRDRGCRAGVALNPHTPAVMIDHLWDLLNLVLVMTVNPGFGGQKFLPAMLPKIRQIRERIEAQGLEVDITADGGVNPETVGQVVEAGANIMAVGHTVFAAPEGIATAVRQLRETATAAASAVVMAKEGNK